MLCSLNLMPIIVKLLTEINWEIFSMLLSDIWVLEEKLLKKKLMAYFKLPIPVVMEKLPNKNFMSSLKRLPMHDSLWDKFLKDKYLQSKINLVFLTSFLSLVCFLSKRRKLFDLVVFKFIKIPNILSSFLKNHSSLFPSSLSRIVFETTFSL